MCLTKCIKFALFADNRILITYKINLIVYHEYTKIKETPYNISQLYSVKIDKMCLTNIIFLNVPCEAKIHTVEVNCLLTRIIVLQGYL